MEKPKRHKFTITVNQFFCLLFKTTEKKKMTNFETLATKARIQREKLKKCWGICQD
jgi:hypothetical protein